MNQSLSIEKSKLLRRLHSAKHRRRERLFLAEGDRLLTELAGSDASVRFVVAERSKSTWAEGRFPGVPIYAIDDGDDSLFATQNSQGVVAVVEMPEPPDLEELLSGDRPLLYLDRIADPGNAGTILRSVQWFGLGGLLLGEGCVDIYNPKAVRATMGAVFSTPIVEGVCLDRLPEHDRRLYALDASAAQVLGDDSLDGHGIFIVGSEATGVDEALLAVATPVSIRGGGHGESLNAAVAASILCYELRRGA